MAGPDARRGQTATPAREDDTKTDIYEFVKINIMTDRRLVIPVTPVIITYLMHHDVATRNEITIAVYRFAQFLDTANATIRVDGVFRGHLHNPEKGIESETVDRELWYWVSNDFVTMFDCDDNNDICFLLKKRSYFNAYRRERLEQECIELRCFNSIPFRTGDERRIFVAGLMNITKL